VLEVQNLTKKFNNNIVLYNINFKVNKGEIVGILGPNGSGKSTLLKIILGIIKPDSGKVSVFNYDSKYDDLKIKEITGYVPEEIKLYEFLTGFEFLKFVAEIRGINDFQKIENFIKAFEIEDKINDMIATYSLGMKQKISIISALLHKPKLLLLDEPFNGLDPKSAKILKDIIMNLKQDSIILISSHILEIIQTICDRIILINKGKIILDDKVENINKKEYKDLEDLFLKLTGGERIREIVEALLK